MNKLIKKILFIFLYVSFGGSVFSNCVNKDNTRQKTQIPERLRISPINPHLLETQGGKPVFLNNNTIWELIRNSKREDIPDLIALCKKSGYNMVSAVILGESKNSDKTVYGVHAFKRGTNGLPNPLEPVTTTGNTPNKPEQYDYWDHIEYIVDLLAKNGMYISLHPAWGCWFSGHYLGERPGDHIIFSTEKIAYKYGQWLGSRYKNKTNIIWMLGGDRSAIYGKEHDYRNLYNAMAEGLADGVNGENKQDGQANYTTIPISFHPRKWAPNSSEWFHNAPWLMFNSIQDTPYDQVASIMHDFNLHPEKPVWLFEGRYEGPITAWGVRYQAYQTVFSGAFGHTYGGGTMYKFPPDWKKQTELPGSLQMKYLYYIAYKIWTDEQYVDRMPDQSLIIGDQGETKGDGISVGDGNGNNKANNGTSNRITAMRGASGKWALVYTANGRNINLDLSCLSSGKLNAYWFNPRNGKWWSGETETEKMTPFLKKVKIGNGSSVFDPPGVPEAENDWILLLK